MQVHWTTDYEGVANSFGYYTHNVRARQALVAAGVTLDERAPVALHVVPPHRFVPVPGKRNIAYCAWEASELPALIGERLRHADAVCVTAEFLREPFQEAVPGVPVYVVPEGVDGDVFTTVDRMSGRYRPVLQTGRKAHRPFRYLWVGAPNNRKGPRHVMEAWKAFTHFPELEDRCELYIKTSLPADSKVRKGVVRIGNVIYDDRRLPIEQLVHLYHRAHCFVFPSTGEGFGLTFAEALATGLPAVYTPATALVDLAPLDRELAYPVQFSYVRQRWTWSNADAEGTPMEVDANIASADTTDLARQMIYVLEHYDEALGRGRCAAAWIRDRFTWARCGEKLADVVRQVYHDRENVHGEEESCHEVVGQ